MATGQPFGYVASVWSFGERSTIGAGLTRYLAAPGGTALASDLAVVAVKAGTLKNLHWSSAASTLTGAGNRITLYVNGAATPLVSTWNAAVKSGIGTPDLVPVAPGDAVSIRIQLAAGAGTITRPRVSIELEIPNAIPWLSDGTDLYYDGGGKVGIGTDSPAEALSVNGTIESTTGGFRFPDGSLQATAFGGIQPPMPPGAVIAYAGSAVPAGWLLCDGTPVDRAVYADLYAAIADAHGAGDGASTFNLPDYRGLFLRGVTGSTETDPEAPARTAMAPGGNAGNLVGSVQDDNLRAHQHSLGVGTGDCTTMLQVNDPRRTGRLASFKDDLWNQPGLKWTNVEGTGTETRPANAYVNYIIKT